MQNRYLFPLPPQPLCYRHPTPCFRSSGCSAR
jgi:hypothetical protein